MLPNRTSLLDVNGCIPQVLILDIGVVTPMVSQAFATALGINIHTLTPRRPFLAAGWAMEE